MGRPSNNGKNFNATLTRSGLGLAPQRCRPTAAEPAPMPTTWAGSTDRRDPFMLRLVPPRVSTACLASLLLWGYSPVLFRNRQFGFRDSVQYYYPLYERVQQDWTAGRWPLWESEESGGMPLLGNPTAAVLYPG